VRYSDTNLVRTIIQACRIRSPSKMYQFQEVMPDSTVFLVFATLITAKNTISIFKYMKKLFHLFVRAKRKGAGRASGTSCKMDS